MATIPTQNAVPSEAPRDLKFNSGKIDEFVTSLEHEYKDRFGRCHMTIEGMRWIFDQLMERFKVDINQAIIAAGYIPMDSFQLGAEITKRNEILRDETTGEYYRWDGDLPKSVPAGSTPESTGGVGMGAWVSVGDASLRSDLSRGNGSGLVGFDDDTTYNAIKGRNFKKSVVASLPFYFNGYSDALLKLEASNLYPQGACYDKEDNLYIQYFPNNPSGLSVICVYSADSSLITWFYMPSVTPTPAVDGAASQGITLYSRVIGNPNLMKFELSTLPAAGYEVNISEGIETPIPYGSYFSVQGNLLCNIQEIVSIGGVIGENILNIYDKKTFELKGNVYLSKMLIGFEKPSDSEYYYKNWKLQGITFSNGRIYIGVGGSYIPYTSDNSLNNVHDIGVVECSVQGDVIRHSVVKAQGFIDELNKSGFNIKRTESEGVLINSNGDIHSLVIGELVSINGGTTPTTDDGIIIVRELNGTGIDFASHASGFIPLSRSDMMRIMRSPTAAFIDPVKMTQFDDFSKVLDFISSYQITEFSFFAGIAELSPISGMPYERDKFYTIKNVNSSTMSIAAASGSKTSFTVYYVAIKENGLWSGVRTTLSANELNITPLEKTSRLTMSTSSGNKLSMIQQAYTGTSSPLTLGGGALGMHAPTNIFFNLDPSVTSTTGGVIKMQLTPASLLPGSLGGITLGSTALPFGDIYSTNGQIVVSDRRLKENITDIDRKLELVAKKLCPKVYTSVISKNENPRKHIGFIAQEIAEAFESEGLNPFDFGILCMESFDSLYRDINESFMNENGEEEVRKIGEELVHEAGERMMVRYDELFSLLFSVLIKNL